MTGNLGAYVEAAAVGIVAAVYVLNLFNLLPKRRSAVDTEAEIGALERRNKQLGSEIERLRRLTDISPILDTLNHVVDALDRHTVMTEQVFEKVADMNGSLRSHAVAMQALADRLVLDEAARGLLAAAAVRPTSPS